MQRPWAILLPVLLAGCSASLWEQIDEPATLPRPCSEPTRVFDTFTMRVTEVARTAAGDLEVTIVFANDRSWPVALSNSGMGVLYNVEFRLQGQGGTVEPKQATGIALTREPRQFQEPPRRPIFSPPIRNNRGKPPDDVRDVNFRIKPGAPEEAKLFFTVPRATYLLTIERKFRDAAASGRYPRHVAACAISG